MKPFCFTLLLVLTSSRLATAAGEPATSGYAPSLTTSVPALLAEEATTDNSWSIRKVFALVNNRTRVIQVCVALMCFALFILIKK
jgi:hypothetical protein